MKSIFQLQLPLQEKVLLCIYWYMNKYAMTVHSGGNVTTIQSLSMNEKELCSNKVAANIALNVALESHANSWLQYSHPDNVEICVC